MKKTLQILATGLLVMISITAFSQAPQKFSYQTVIRNSSNQLLANQQVGIKISVLQGSETGIVVYSERHTPITNSNGLATLSIGTGTVLNGNFQDINWSSGTYYIQTETDPNGGNNYTITSTQQLLSVPYALYAETSGNSILGPQGPTGPQGPIGLTGATGPQGQAGNPASDDQQLTVSATGDTLFLQNGGFVIIPGISIANGSESINSIMHTCGADSIHNPDRSYGMVTDQEGNIYKTIVIGTQEWMAENLNVSHFSNGDSLINVISDSEWGSLTTPAWSSFNNDASYDCPYGKLYNWYAASDSRNVCPINWHVPSDWEWQLLEIYLGISQLDANSNGGRGLEVNAGGKLKATKFWAGENINANNEIGFSALGSSVRPFNGIFTPQNHGNSAQFWTSTQINSSSAWPRWLLTSTGLIYRNSSSKTVGQSIRCIAD
jgi:uncharacterized protein (TIGR02145 family)